MLQVVSDKVIESLSDGSHMTAICPVSKDEGEDEKLNILPSKGTWRPSLGTCGCGAHRTQQASPRLSGEAEPPCHSSWEKQ